MFHWYINVYDFIIIMRIEKSEFINILSSNRGNNYNYNNKNNKYYYNNNINNR